MFGSYLNNNNNLQQNQIEKPQQNQFLTGNPSTDPNAQTDWMNPSSSVPNSGFSGMGSSGGATPIASATNNGTALGAIGSGNSSVGQYTPEGYDTGKLNDPANANSLKYQVGRILSNYPPGQAGLQQAAQQLQALGISVVGKDSIRLPDGTTADVGRAFSDPNAQHAWQYNWSGPMDGSGQSMPTSYMGSQQQQNPMQNSQFMNQILQQMFASQQAQRKFTSQEQMPNQQGGFIPPTGGFSGYESALPNQIVNNGSEMSYLGGGVYDPELGRYRNPRRGEPQ